MWQKAHIIYNLSSKESQSFLKEDKSRLLYHVFSLQPNLRKIIIAYELYKRLKKEFSKKEIFKPLIFQRPPKNGDLKVFYELIESIKLEEEDYFKNLYKKYKEAFKLGFDIKKLDMLIKNVLGLEMKEKYFIIPVYDLVVGGAVIFDNFIEIRYNELSFYNNRIKNDVDVFVHEVLHSVLKPLNLEHDFEEALISYFAPCGLFSVELGLCSKEKLKQKKKDFKKSFRYEVYKEAYDLLDPIMEEYSLEKGNIFEFLKSKGIKISFKR